jgi:hypothetical protein
MPNRQLLPDQQLSMAYLAVDKDYSSKVGLCPGILDGPQCRDSGTLGRFSLPILLFRSKINLDA